MLGSLAEPETCLGVIVIFRLFRLQLAAILVLLLILPYATHAAESRPMQGPNQPVEADVQVFLDAQPGPLKSYREGERTAAELIQAADTYYGISPRILLALLEATGGLLSDSAPPDQVLRQPFGSAGPDGFTNQLDWVGRELRAGLGPYD
ncbi:MAG: hypothetical protein ABI901_15865, partial [Roseiflexaceae bacterium]